MKPTPTGFLALLLLLAASCSADAKREVVAPTIIEDDDPAETREYRIIRSEYEAVLKEGIQPVMRWYFVKPHYRRSKFVGYEVNEVLREELQKGPILPGDVILSINSSPIERPEHAMAIWRGLWPRKTLDLKLLRKGKPVSYVIPIVSDSQ
jgi:type II secretory pathway component PulC